MARRSAVQQQYTVEVAGGEEANGVASILCTLLQQNFEKFPERVAIARHMPRPVAVSSTDTDTSATITFGPDRAVIRNGLLDKPSVVVLATVNQILDVAQLKVNGKGLVPTGFFTRRGGKVLGDIARRRLVVKGLLTHTFTSLRLIALVSIAE
jgi:hypothetical protein